MNILVTGANGNLGKVIFSTLISHGFSVKKYSHCQDLSDIDWVNVDTVINCSAAIPKHGVENKHYFEANIRFVQELLVFSRGKRVIHFSTLSQLYKHDTYQRSKLIGDSLLMINKHIFKELHLIYLPTIEDSLLINSICDKANSGEAPVVDHLKYNYMSFEDVGNYVANNINSNFSIPISKYFQLKDLYNEVNKFVSSELLKEGPFIDRTLMSEDAFYIQDSLENYF
ncbi:NAD(P)-dependent oxidoreductase [Vibrio tubiashii]|uniref:NAD(P)-dependent oxidoreductase n=1 Tax=Vibrio tubiashii TaxID=29498 RepID=A0AAE5LJ45_9VIBR|nr:NAD(P)-dependent oxidoreductase [Vibrio tubiashii]NOI82318.1 NAD(P)-dependent oxidoreductase [Vibrio tubiashii]